MSRVFVIVVDGFGVAPDGGETSTLGTLCEQYGRKISVLPVLFNMGLDAAVTGRGHVMRQASVAVGSEEGHREMFGWITKQPHPIPSEPLPRDVLMKLGNNCGVKLIGNKQGRGRDVLPELWLEHLQTGAIMLYRGLDSTVVVSADEIVVPRECLYKVAQALRCMLDASAELCVKKVLARPLRGGEPVEELRRDFFQMIDGESLLQKFVPLGWRRIVNGKVQEILSLPANMAVRTERDEQCFELLNAEVTAAEDEAFIMVNLEDFDRYAHMGDASACWRTLERFDAFLQSFLDFLRSGDWVFVVADHGVKIGGGDLGSAHLRERVPLLCASFTGPMLRIPSYDTYAVVGQAVGEIAGCGRPTSLCRTSD
ncbi:MAG TPA: hypothetical protein PLI51_03040 [bacterium]|nr:hypothetical protein [bacterium]HPQ65693.1 hypothetical protein [bacterium]